MSDKRRCDACDVALIPSVQGYECGMHPVSELEKVSGYIINDGTKAFADWDAPGDGPIMVCEEDVSKREFWMHPHRCCSFVTLEGMTEMMCPECGDWWWR